MSNIPGETESLSSGSAAPSPLPQVSAPEPMPSVARQAWNLARSLAEFVADGCATVSKDMYRQRLEICQTCDFRSNNRCTRCGCFLPLKARGRAFTCPEGKWPSGDPATP